MLVLASALTLQWAAGMACAEDLGVPTPGAPIRIGLVGPFTGGSADFGNSMRLGVELAVKEINSFGGYMGRPFRLVVRDDKATPAVGRAAATELVTKDRVDFTIGYCNTGVAMQAIDVFQTHSHLLMVPCSQGSAVTEKFPAKDSYIFRVAPTDTMNAQFLVGDIVGRRGLKRVAVLADTTAYGEGGVRDLTTHLAKRGLAPVFVGRFAIGVKSLTDPLKAARAADADALVVWTVGPEHAVAVKSRQQLGWNVPYFATWPLSFGSVLEQAGASALEGTMMTQTLIRDTANERRSSFLLAYLRHSPERVIGSLMSAGQGYDAMHLMLRALFVSKGDTAGPALKRALESLPATYRGVVTNYDSPFDSASHDAYSANMIWLGTWTDGHVVYAYPDDARMSALPRRKAGNEP